MPIFVVNDSGSETSINNTDGQYTNANNTQDRIDPPVEYSNDQNCDLLHWFTRYHQINII